LSNISLTSIRAHMTKPIVRVYHSPSNPEAVARWTAERRLRDGVETLPDGFSFRPSGRHGYIYYRQGKHVVALNWAMSGSDNYDLILFTGGLCSWALPQAEPLDEDRQTEIQSALREWLSANKLRATFEEGSS